MMISQRPFTPLLVLSLLLLTACLGDSRPETPLSPNLTPSLSHVTTENRADGEDDNDGQFFFRPPIDDDEVPSGPLASEVLPFTFVELCNVEGLSWGETESFTSVCPDGRQVALIGETLRVQGQTLNIQSGADFDFFQTVLKLNRLIEEEALGDLHVIRVIIGVPDTEGAFVVPGYVEAEFTENASEQNREVSPLVLRVGDLPVKSFVGGDFTDDLFCGKDVTCSYNVFDLGSNTEASICFPVSNCGNGAIGGLEMGTDALAEAQEILQDQGLSGNASLVLCEPIDPAIPSRSVQ